MKHIARIATVLSVFIGLVAPASPADAATLTVTRSDDPAPDGCTADCSLREAIIDANDEGTNPGPDTITLPAGRFVLSIAGDREDASATGDLDITSDVTIAGSGAGKTVVDADAIDRVFHVHDDAVVTFSDLTVTGGSAGEGSDGGGGIRIQGSPVVLIEASEVVANAAGWAGGILNDGLLTIVDSRISSNTADLTGGIWNTGELTIRDSVVARNEANRVGGLTNEVSQSPTTISGSTFSNNISADGDGGAIINIGRLELLDSRLIANRANGNLGGAIRNIDPGGSPSPNKGQVIVTGSTLSDNEAAFGGGAISSFGTTSSVTVTASILARNRVTDFEDANGGAIEGENTTIVMSDSVVSDNEAWSSGGGIALDESSATITGSLLSGNSTDGGPGGALSNGNGGDVLLASSTVSNNHARFGGGGLFNGASTLQVSTSTIARNTAANGGGIYQGSGNLTVEDSTLSGNTADDDGGGIFVGSGDAALTSVTITENVADGDADDTVGDGGGLAAVGGTTTMKSSILAGNDDQTPAALEPEDCVGTFTSGGFNVTGIIGGCTVVDRKASDTTGTFTEPLDPDIGPLLDNGGPSQTHAIAAGSPAHDRHSSSDADCGETDQRGVPRPGGAGCDAGAYELEFCGPRVVNVVGTEGADVLVGSDGDDGILGLGGADRLSGKGGKDALCGGAGSDLLIGGSGKDKLDGGPGRRDRCVGGSGKDKFVRCEQTRQ